MTTNHKTHTSQFLSGLGSGVCCSAMLNPWDRALYLSVKERRPFLRVENFRNPYNGVVAATVSKITSHGMYFPLYDTFLDIHRSWIDPSHTVVLKFLAGNCAGSVNAVLTSPISAVKYRMWGMEQEAYIATATKMFRESGNSLRPFFRGLYPTVLRDTVWGGSFAILNHTLQSNDFVSSNILATFSSATVAAVVATVLSAPLNYVRNKNFAAPLNERPPKPSEALKGLWKNMIQHQAPFWYLQERFGIGWGTLRVGVGMAISSELYRFFLRKLD
eukprot:PhF_6_TR15517/c0_g1_i1/m.24143/K15103/UCP2_3, SLC25A8_9; solute carrier family 25 (mitochondrial uncoupling protein), member 8/9